jgi:ABC-type multidrug transport system ATPase subunit
MVSFTKISKQYGRQILFVDASFQLNPGEKVGLVGPNGSGKTTLFECLGGVLPADAGTIADDGRTLTAAERKARVFYLPDAIAPWPAQTVRWALDFVTGFFRDQRPRTNDERPTTTGVVRQLDLEALLDSPIGTLSKGQRKRALLAIGLLTPQPILLADEPFDGLDLRQTREVAQTLRAHAAGGRTMFLSIHQITDAARVCDRFVLLSGGRVRGEGTLEELSATAHTGDEKNLEEVFLALT